MTIDVKTFVVPPLRNNNYVLIDTESHEAVLVDCSEPSDKIMTYIKEQGAVLKYILLTHAHFDHVLGVNYFKDKYRVPVYLPKYDQQLLTEINDYVGLLSIPNVKIPQTDGYSEDVSLYVGSYPIKVIATPGHTEGSVCYHVDNLLFSGDTLFHDGCGRTDFPGGSADQMKASLQLLFDTLPIDTIVYPGHGKSTTLQAERHLYR